ncbi:MAG: DUF302 domain-containing protein [Chloroflexi bacterium]|nr:DUF302 domain-containing protein [Chloroflexota bacterium]
MPQTTTDYGFHVQVNLPYEQAIEKVTAALKTEGFGVLTEIDVKATFKKKLDVDFRKYVILGACNPILANQALNAELGIGLLLPCNVIVYDDENGGAVVSIIDPLIMMGMVDNPNLGAVANEAYGRLQRVSNAIATAM